MGGAAMTMEPHTGNPQSTASIAGPPIHPMLIPFPIAFFVATFVRCGVLDYRRRRLVRGDDMAARRGANPRRIGRRRGPHRRAGRYTDPRPRYGVVARWRQRARGGDRDRQYLSAQRR